jgi:HTH-type transcriptional regulator / antitoxin HigA
MALTLRTPPAKPIDAQVYGQLLSKTQPRVIRSEKDNRKAAAELERLDTLGRPMTPEEDELAELLTALIAKFEDDNYPIGKSGPLDNLRALMEQRELRQVDLLSVFGASSTASQVLTGKRTISKAQAKKLAALFRVPADIFL